MSSTLVLNTYFIHETGHGSRSAAHIARFIQALEIDRPWRGRGDLRRKTGR